ncbi:fatty acid synthase-like [Vespula maculifrons]|uniref:Fatty acid synthase-like n=1 Tax=Vespula maculifrons TaxID=7453 RepID=A0ABD2CT47_VESMC
MKSVMRTVFDKYQIVAALRFVLAEKRMGKISRHFLFSRILLMLIYFMCLNILLFVEYCSVLTIYIIICIIYNLYEVFDGLGGFDMELVDMMILRNAQNISLTLLNVAEYGSIYKNRIMAIMQRESQEPGLFLCISVESFKRKAPATKYLDEETRNICLDFGHFIVFSLVSYTRGNVG